MASVHLQSSAISIGSGLRRYAPFAAVVLWVIIALSAKIAWYAAQPVHAEETAANRVTAALVQQNWHPTKQEALLGDGSIRVLVLTRAGDSLRIALLPPGAEYAGVARDEWGPTVSYFWDGRRQAGPPSRWDRLTQAANDVAGRLGIVQRHDPFTLAIAADCAKPVCADFSETGLGLR